MTMRRAAAHAVLVAGLLASAAAQTDRGEYTIRSFDTDLTVDAGADLLVEERIEVVFSAPRHGIYRTIPVRYSDPRGYAYSLDVRLIGVAGADGRAHTTKVTSEGRYVKIRIGDEDRTVEGTVVYVLRYRVRDALGQFAEHDEIYWNATGHEWNASIGRSSATVRLPGGIPAGSLRTAGYTGAFGARERDVEITHPSPGVVRFVTTRPLGPLEGLTVAVGFPQGAVAFPSAWQRAGRLAADNWIVLLPLAWLGYLLRRYWLHGRDPDPRAPVVVAYEPPPDLTPGGVGTLVDERVDLADITATVVDLAVRRHLTIRTDEQDRLFGLLTRQETVFVREPAAGKGSLAPYELKVMNALFARGDEVRMSDLKNRFYTHIPGIQTALYDQLVAHGYFDASPEATRRAWAWRGLPAAVVTGLAGYAWMTWRGLLATGAAIVPAVAGGLTWLLFRLCSPAMPRRTAKGAHARQWALGFQEFARRVEGDRLERSAADPRQAFERLLPYAMALGVAGEWARKFEGIYTQRAPDWYVGQVHSGSHGFSTRSFEQNLSSAMSRTGQSMAASPRSASGSGGGGSSGGGGGGGGGGSW